MTQPITGLKEVDKKLKDIARRDARRIGRNVINAGLTVARKGIVSEVPVGKTKKLKKSVGKRFKKSHFTHLLEAKVGTNVAKKRIDQARHGHLVGAGTRQRETESGANRGRVKPNNFIERGWRKVAGRVKTAIRAKLKEGIAKLRK